MGTVNAPRIVLVMGVAGSGKTTVGQLLAHQLGWQFNDADEFHSPANVAKMSAGLPLSDTDREPWLGAIRTHMEHCLAERTDAVVTCSALKQAYRHVLMNGLADVRLAYLHGSRELLLARISSRQGHFMKPAILDSQLAALEQPNDALKVSIDADPPALVATIRTAFSL